LTFEWRSRNLEITITITEHDTNEEALRQRGR